jgi:conjugal transfer pilus assembly protein TraI
MLKKILQRFSNLVGDTSKEVVVEAPIVAARRAAAKTRVDTVASRVPVYPPIDPGIEVLAVEDILESQSDLMKRIRTVAGGDAAEFEDRYLSVIRNLAEYVHLLPASRQETHTGAGGLFRLSLEMGFYCLQASEGVIFTPTEGVERRHNLEPRWRYAAFLAGLCSELHRPLASLIVSGPEGVQWPKYLLPLHRWCDEGGFGRYHISWQAEPRFETAAAKGEVSAMISRIVPDRCLQYLEAGSPAIAPVVFSVATGVARDNENSVSELVARIRRRVLDRDKAVRPDYYGTMLVGNHLEPHLLEAMRTLIRTGKWKINEEGGRVWFALDGLFIIWKKAAEELSREIAEKGLQGVPTEANTLAEALLNAKVFTGSTDRNPYWQVTLPNQKEYLATKIVNPLSLFGDVEVSPLQITLVGRSTAASASSVPAPTADAASAPAQAPAAHVPAVVPATGASNAPADSGAAVPATPDGKAPDRLTALMKKQKDAKGESQPKSAMRTLDPTELGERTADEAIAERVADGGSPVTAEAGEHADTQSTAERETAGPKLVGKDAGGERNGRQLGKTTWEGEAASRTASGFGARVASIAGEKGGVAGSARAPGQQRPQPAAEQTEFSYTQLLPESYRAKFKPFLGETLGRLIADYRTGDHQDKFLLDRDGLCVSFKYAGTLGAPLPVVIEELDRLNMLYVDPASPGKKQHPRRLPGSDKDTPCLVIAMHAVTYLEISQ